MPLNNQTPARDAGYQNVQYFRKRIQFSDAITTFTFRIPAGSIILAPLSGVDVQTVFNAGTNNRLQIGISGAVSKYGLNVSMAALGFAPMAVAVGHKVTVETDILFTVDVSGTAATTGDAELVLAFINPN
jgi:predicted membrane metal-binding protein